MVPPAFFPEGTMAAPQMRITEIVCLKSIELKTGRPRILHPEDMDGTSWQRIVEQAERTPSDFDVHRVVVATEKEQAEDIEAIPTKRLLKMGREKVATIAGHYGIKDTGQTRSTLVDQIGAERDKQAEVSERLGLNLPDTDGDDDPDTGD